MKKHYVYEKFVKGYNEENFIATPKREYHITGKANIKIY